MLRFYKDFIERILMVLVYYDLQYGYDMQHIAKNISNCRPKDDNLANRVYTTGDAVLGGDYDMDPPATMQDTIGTLQKVLNDIDKGKVKDGDLIDVIVKTLQLPYARSAISGKALSDIRKALLLPSEMAGLTALKQRELSCLSCGHKFVDGEMTTVTQMDNGVNVGLWCTNCSRPKYVACSKCEESTELSKPVGRALAKTKFECAKHLNERAEVKVKAKEDGPVVVNARDVMELLNPADTTGVFTTEYAGRGNPVPGGLLGMDAVTPPFMGRARAPMFQTATVARPRRTAREYADLGIAVDVDNNRYHFVDWNNNNLPTQPMPPQAVDAPTPFTPIVAGRNIFEEAAQALERGPYATAQAMLNDTLDNNEREEDE